MRYRIQTMLTRQFYRRTPQRFWNPSPMRMGTAKLIQLALQLHDGLWNRLVALVVQSHPTSTDI